MKGVANIIMRGCRGLIMSYKNKVLRMNNMKILNKQEKLGYVTAWLSFILLRRNEVYE